MSEVVISAAAAVTGLGDTLERTWQRLLAGQSAIAPVERFAAGAFTSSIAACVAQLEPAANGSRLPSLLERLLDGFAPVPADSRLLLATTKGAIDLLEAQRRGAAVAEGALLPAALLADLEGRLGLSGPSCNINAACASSTIAVARGAAAIARGSAEAAVVLCCDLLSEFVFSGFSALRALDPRPSRPFDRQRAGLTLGEGAAALLLMSRERALREQRPVLARVLGWGSANDAHHITAPARDGSGLIRAVRQALATAGVSAAAVDGISAHGTGTVYNDLMELTAFRTLFGERCPPLHSVKGALGHTLGAAGGIEVALGLRSLATGLLPPTVGLEQAEPGAEGLVSADSQPFAGRLLLSTNSGFGGINGALLLGQEVAA
ncbi:3-oxoacyl-[acyl-carrier-protein] synthase 2 [Desulfuromonas versatilis]|uniref:3-oxoacyl-[acyl-carrier-protein] synthase 2 n=1 Tax=Desulfuromonas versatilis TaxID=2802975 RepID=A0ABM8HNQ8_9BACT|nr:beta-ketoacyl synthase N-terminal-like domain-containing protein [Desulfuromonas versatilis]BCR03192.1 3-oxoacyl-[acyl-carrier-protein] synthase 2 [Desulfuromonas versatilis]